jgi:hypothetical protein
MKSPQGCFPSLTPTVDRQMKKPDGASHPAFFFAERWNCRKLARREPVLSEVEGAKRNAGSLLSYFPGLRFASCGLRWLEGRERI